MPRQARTATHEMSADLDRASSRNFVLDGRKRLRGMMFQPDWSELDF
jgi:hypothetical protein